MFFQSANFLSVEPKSRRIESRVSFCMLFKIDLILLSLLHIKCNNKPERFILLASLTSWLSSV